MSLIAKHCWPRKYHEISTNFKYFAVASIQYLSSDGVIVEAYIIHTL